MKTWNWITASLVMSLACLVSTARADHLIGLQQEAANLDATAHALCDEVRFSLREANNFPVIVAKVEALESRVHALQQIVAQPSSVQQLYAQLDVLDRLLVSAENSVLDAAAGQAHWGHHHRLNNQRAQQLLDAMDNQIHHMEDHVDALRNCDLPGNQQPIFQQQPVFQQPGYQQDVYQQPAYQQPQYNLRPQFPTNGNPGWNQPQQINPGWNNQPANGWNNGYVPNQQTNNVNGRPGIGINAGGVSINGRPVISFGR